MPRLGPAASRAHCQQARSARSACAAGCAAGSASHRRPNLRRAGPSAPSSRLVSPSLSRSGSSL
eukprot:6607449-Prymnesium_polylepis.1